MTEATEQTIDLDRKTRAIVSGARVAIQRLQSDGAYDMVVTFQGGGRSIARWCEQNDVHPTRAAEQVLAALPDVGFRDRG